MDLLGTKIGSAVSGPQFGIDVSHHNGVIDWQTVAKNIPHVSFAFIKATEGSSSKDSRCAYNAREAAKQGIKIGYYHFATLNREDEIIDAREEATFFLDTIKVLPRNDLPLILDIESTNPKVTLNDGEVLAYIKAFFDVLAAAGKKYALYSYTPFLNEHLPADHNLGEIPLWIAAYTNKPLPKIPTGWDQYWIWQYSGSGKCAGISTPCDLNKTWGYQ